MGTFTEALNSQPESLFFYDSQRKKFWERSYKLANDNLECENLDSRDQELQLDIHNKAMRNS